jgi:hypothetical protein
MLDKLINLGFQIVSDEVEEAVNNQSIPFDWNIMGWDKSRPAMTRENGRSMIEPNPEHIRRKIDAIIK